MRTNIEIDDRMMAEVMTISKAKTKKEAIHILMYDYIRRQKMKELAELRGKIQWEGNLDEMREGNFIEGWM